jgi:predicted DNA binding CopG/RHH family protein
MAQSKALAQAISILPAGSFQSHLDSVMVAPQNGLELPRRLPFEKWLNIGKQLSAINTSSAWCLGDWLAYGIETFNGRYRSAVEQTALDYQTLRNYVWVAKCFPRSRRRVALSFGHHAEVAALPEPEQDFWLRKAEELGWSVKQLRQEVRASLREREAAGPIRHQADESRQEDESHQEDESLAADQRLAAGEGGVGPGLVKLNIQICPHQLESCKTAAAKAGLEIQEWVVMALTKAVYETLGPAAVAEFGQPVSFEGRIQGAGPVGVRSLAS